MWVSTQTWPVVEFDESRVSDTGKFAKMKLLFKANKAQQKLKSRTGHITFPQLGRPSDLNIVCYADATNASLEDGSSQDSLIIFVCGTMNRIISICWSSKKLDWVTKSLLASETLALSKAAEAGVLIAVMLQETFRLSRLPEVFYKTDNVSLIETINSWNLVRDWCPRIDVAWVKEMMVKKEI